MLNESAKESCMIEFNDCDHEQCIIQTSNEEKLWIGRKNNTMHLDRVRLRLILAYLQLWLKKGNFIPAPDVWEEVDGLEAIKRYKNAEAVEVSDDNGKNWLAVDENYIYFESIEKLFINKWRVKK